MQVSITSPVQLEAGNDPAFARLQYLLQNTSRLNSFAEAKNGALLALSGAAVFGVVQNIDKITNAPVLMQIWFLVTLGQLVIVMLICIAAFLPRMSPYGEYLTDLTDPEKANLAFFGDTAKLRSDTFLQKTISIQSDDPDYRFAKDLAVQILTESRICARKYNYFNLAAIIALGAIATPAAIPIALIMRRFQLL